MVRSSALISVRWFPDLRESGSIEQDADMVILLHREDMYNPESDRVGEADMIIVLSTVVVRLVLFRWRLAVSTAL